MKKILLSLGTLVVVGAIVAGATIAFYNDTETSTGNIFTAGSIDLKVDHKFQSYNGHDCEEFCEPVGQNLVLNGGFENPDVTHSAQWDIFQSGTSGLEWTIEWVGNTTSFGGYNRPAPALVEYHEGVLGLAYEGNQYSELDSDWFGPSHSLSGEPASVRIYQDISTIPGKKYRVTFAFAPRPNTGSGENQLQFSWDNSPVDVVSSSAGGGPIVWSFKSYDVTASGNTTRVAFADVGTENSLGTFLDDVKVVELNCNYTLPGAESCQLWEEANLTNQKFFDFRDVKPADWGINVISLHVTSNDAYACLIINNKDDQENPAQPLAPELAAGDVNGSGGNPLGNGELSNFLNVFTWKDIDGDGIYDVGESAITPVPVSLSSLGSIASLDTLSSYLPAMTAQDIGLAWCAGTLTPNQGGAFGCDGNGMGNIAQSDSFTADLTAYAEQTRNNPNFTCASVVLPSDL